MLYFLRDNLDFFWTDFLAGITPGTPAMEYMLVSNEKITMKQSLLKDLKPSRYIESDGNVIRQGDLLNLKDRELMSDAEMIENMKSWQWNKVFEDFSKYPPELILDASPTGIKGFTRYPIDRSEVFKRFLVKNYHYETTIEKVIIYRRNEGAK